MTWTADGISGCPPEPGARIVAPAVPDRPRLDIHPRSPQEGRTAGSPSPEVPPPSGAAQTLERDPIPVTPCRSAGPLGPEEARAVSSRSLRLPYLGVWAPLVVAVGVLALDTVEGPTAQFVGLLVAAPFLAAALAGPGTTAGVGAAVLALATVFGFHQPGGPGSVEAAFSGPQVVRLVFILLASAGAVVVSGIRLRREDRLTSLAAVASAAQTAIMRPVEPVVGPVRCVVRYTSAAREAQIGGDLVEVLDTPHGVRAILGDVRGKGLDSVRMAAQVLGSFREQAFVASALGGVAVALDASVRRLAGPEDFVTVLLIQVRRDGELSVLSCGHPSPLLARAGEAPVAQAVGVLHTEPHHPPLGLLAGAPTHLVTHLAPGDRLVAVTDGVLEARRERRFFDASAALRTALAGRDLEAGMDELLAQLTTFVRGQLRDDVAVLGLELVAPAPLPPPAR